MYVKVKGRLLESRLSTTNSRHQSQVPEFAQQAYLPRESSHRPRVATTLCLSKGKYQMEPYI